MHANSEGHRGQYTGYFCKDLDRQVNVKIPRHLDMFSVCKTPDNKQSDVSHNIEVNGAQNKN